MNGAWVTVARASSAIVVVASLSAALSAQPDKDQNREYEVKTAYLYNFGIYVEWPAKAAAGNKEFVIGVYGKQPDDELLKKLASTRMVGAKKIRFYRMASAKEYKPCHVLFISDPTGNDGKAVDRLRDVAAKANGDNVLIVSESDGLITKGSAMNFYLDGNNVKFEVNTGVIRKAGLTVSSRLLSLAKIADE